MLRCEVQQTMTFPQKLQKKLQILDGKLYQFQALVFTLSRHFNQSMCSGSLEDCESPHFNLKQVFHALLCRHDSYVLFTFIAVLMAYLAWLKSQPLNCLFCFSPRWYLCAVIPELSCSQLF